jgi:hypothetical protein
MIGNNVYNLHDVAEAKAFQTVAFDSLIDLLLELWACVWNSVTGPPIECASSRMKYKVNIPS